LKTSLTGQKNIRKEGKRRFARIFNNNFTQGK